MSVVSVHGWWGDKPEKERIEMVPGVCGMR